MILEKYPYPKGLSFEMVVSHIRRKHMMTALNIGGSQKKDLEQTCNENRTEQVAKGQRVMQALQRMYERKLIMQIKESKRGSRMAGTDKMQVKRTSSQPWKLGLGNRTN